MKKIQILSLACCLLLAASCTKEETAKPEHKKSVPLSYKIEPQKVSELRSLHMALKNGINARIQSESYSTEEFYLLSEAILNSLLVDMQAEPIFMQERLLHLNFDPETLDASALLELLTVAENEIANDLQNVVFDDYPSATPFIHLIDVEWENGLEIYYLVAINPEYAPEFFEFNMTQDFNNSCPDFALAGPLQSQTITFWNQMPFQFTYRPNHLFDPIFGQIPLGPNDPIPHTTYTELRREKVDYANPSDRNYYTNPSSSAFNLWHRIVPDASTPAPCIPDAMGTFHNYALSTAVIGTTLNPNQYHPYGNPNGLVMIGLSISSKSATSLSLNIPNPPPTQLEYWHETTYIYGRQMIYSETPISND